MQSTDNNEAATDEQDNTQKKGLSWKTYTIAGTLIGGGLFLGTCRASFSWLRKYTTEGKKLLTTNENKPITSLWSFYNNSKAGQSVSQKQGKMDVDTKNGLKYRWIYLGNVPIEHRLQYTHFRNANEYWSYHRHHDSVSLAFQALIYATIFTTTLCCAFSYLLFLFLKYKYHIQNVTEMGQLFRKLFSPIKHKIGVDYEINQFDQALEEEVKNMNILEFFDYVWHNFDKVSDLTDKALEENKKKKEPNSVD
ncbi:hypothetical protein RFI_06820 [Reticulomyxa filosa]|uniref:Uncharacterized protein n=1 Tax=Reticulomyxa filosa TaxID=46433 RepID=X6NWU2_RETFI|nr:hypothetical protein RFI_06820 [Reticulomyxa filosa]|eukprot:ETO30299.1 hypothetical protein RFI_06820 [Reticulomyxa filosa]